MEPVTSWLYILPLQLNCTAGKASTKMLGAPSEKPSPQLIPFTVPGITAASVPFPGVVQLILGVGDWACAENGHAATARAAIDAAGWTRTTIGSSLTANRPTQPCPRMAEVREVRGC